MCGAHVTFSIVWRRRSPILWMRSHCCLFTGMPTSCFSWNSSNSHWNTNSGTVNNSGAKRFAYQRLL